MSDQEPLATPRRPTVPGRLLALALLAGCAFLAAVYLARPDDFAAITVCPPWVWSVPAFLALSAYSLRRSGGRLMRVAWLAWIMYVPTLADTPLALLRGVRSSPVNEPVAAPPDKLHVRVISLNCGSFGMRSADDVVDYGPQILLLQESPGSDELAALAEKLYGSRGSYLQTTDASIVADGEIQMLPVHDPQDTHASYARVRLAGGEEVALVSLRLEPALVRLDFWSPECWRSQTENRRTRRGQLSKIAGKLATIPADLPLVLGGDFNAPAGDAVFRALAPRLRDAFLNAGVGWGNTIVNEFPFARIDQVWIDRHWQAATVRAQKTLHSDHRMVIADLWLDRAAGQPPDPR